MAVARAIDVRLICHKSRRSSRLPKRSSPLTRIKRDGLGRYFRNERFGMTLTQLIVICDRLRAKNSQRGQWRCVQSVSPDNAVSHVNYAGETPGLPVSKHQKLRTFARENDALLVYCLTCVFALFLPYTGALVVFTRVATTLLVFLAVGHALLCGVLVSCAHFYRYEDTQIPSGCFDTPIQFPFLNVARVWETAFEIRKRMRITDKSSRLRPLQGCGSSFKDW